MILLLDIKVEVIIDYGLTNIVAQQVDAGFRPRELVARDMIAVRISPVFGWPSSVAFLLHRLKAAERRHRI